MKKIIIAAVMLACGLWANAEEKVIAYAQLPQSAQDFANANFKDKNLDEIIEIIEKVLNVKIEKKKQ